MHDADTTYELIHLALAAMEQIVHDTPATQSLPPQYALYQRVVRVLMDDPRVYRPAINVRLNAIDHAVRPLEVRPPTL